MMGITTLRSLLLAAFVLSNVSWTTSRHHFRHNVNGHRSRHRRQDAGLFHPASYVIPGGEGTGAWGEWGRVSPCSRTCGGGVANQKRICLQVGPDDQPLCTGGDTKYFSCQTQDCPENAGDFRAEQCSEYDHQAFRGSGITYNWVPYTKAPNPCELNCMPRGERFYYRQKSQVVDGTRCNDESFNVCVEGVCQPVGCDMMLGSNAREDKCRNCRGNGTNCYTVAGLLDTDDLRKGYNDMLLIPQGATNVFIEEVRASNNYLALRAKENNVYYLNGDYHIDFPRSLTIAGTLWHYERSQQGLAAPDKLRCIGPTIEPLYLSLLLQDYNVGINYEYSVPSALAPPPNQQYNWVHLSFSECSAPCGGGFQVREVTCRSREELEIVADSLCDEGLKPPTNQTCNIEACPPRWVEGPWSPCSRPCGDGGTRSRQVYCEKIITNRFPSIVADKECFDLLGPKPELYQTCNQNATCPTWFTGPWKPCNRLCGEGKQTRQVVCHQRIKGFVQLFEDRECEDEKPITEKACLLHPCDGVDWVISDWSGCDTCLSTVRTRVAHCATKDHKVIDSNLCSYHPSPVLKEPCDRTKLPSCQVQWYATQWSNCSVECGTGVRTRRVFCGLFDGESIIKVDDERCDKEYKYNDTTECVVPEEKCPAKWFAGPWSECTKQCGGGEQYRRVMCLNGGKKDLRCDKETILDSTQSCNVGPCDKDDLLPIDSKTTPVLDDYDEEDCIEEDEEYPEAGAEAISTIFPDFIFTEDFTSETEISTETGSGFGWSEFSTESDGTSTTDVTLTTETTVTYSTDVTSSTETDVTISTESETTESTYSISTEDIKNSTIDSTISSITEVTDSTPATDELSTKNATPSSSESSVSSTTDNGESSTTKNAASSTIDNAITSTKESTYSISTETFESSITDSTDSTITEVTSSSTEIEELSSIAGESTTSEKGSSTTENINDSTILSSEPSTTNSDFSSTIKTSSSSSTEDGTSSITESESSTTEITESDISSTTEITESDISSTTETPVSDTTENSESTITEIVSSTTESTDSSTIVSTLYSTQESSTFSTIENIKSSTTDNAAFSTTESDLSTTIETGESSTTSNSVSITTEGVQTSSSERALSSSTEVSDSSTTENGVTSTTERDTTGTTENIPNSSTENDQTSTSNATPSTSESSLSSTTQNGESSTTESAASSTTESAASSTTESAVSSTSESDISITTESGTSTSTENTQFSTTASDQSSTTENALSSTTDNSASTTTEIFGTSDISTTEGSTDSTTAESITVYSTESSTTESDVTDTSGSTETTETGGSSTSPGITDASTSSEEPVTNESSVTETTPWDWASTVEVFTNKRHCKPRKTAKCTKSKFGCCPDKRTPAAGPFDEGCPNPETCKDWKYGCCPDGVSPAAGPQGRGCPVSPCNETLYGCCSDNVTASEGNNQEGCPPLPPACKSSKHGCCDDNETEAKGPEKQGCPETEIGTETPTPVVDEGCATSEFGCCFDNETDASGPNGEGCPCSISEYGCCPDGLTTASGNQFEGCLMSCNTSAYGCCPDGETPAHGPQFEGCCLQHVFGCCPDNYKLAEGPHLEGCGCEFAHFGCCTDNITIARGPNMEGCGCEHSRYGCCPDRHTEAQGSEFKGCECHTYQFGCCPDGVTIASGPELEGCRCERSKYGCCGDETTTAKGPNMEGCDCSNSKYGCCPDGQTEAKGDKFLNCSDVPVNRQAACALDNDKGTCRNYTVHWFYDMQYGGCSQFWYGGCEGNGNRFINKEECEDVCVQPSPKDSCNLPKVKATCDGYHVRWYYDSEREQCSQFVYGGCLGNANNFDTKELCQERCEPEKTEDQCNLSLERGPCSGNFARWGFSAERRRCEQFVWGGCGGNNNRYDSEAACQLRCTPPGKPRQACSLPQDAGNCTEKHPAWSFSQTENRCVPFYYSGCGGNDNRFDSEQSCDNSCPSAYVQEMCTLPAMIGDCADYTQRWFFDTTKKRCRLFYYGGCGGNENNFFSESECENRCSELPSTTTVKPEPLQPQTEPAVYRERSEFCMLDIDKGPCTQSLPHWAYDAVSGACIQFQYGGCGGNRNNFPTLEYCEHYCGSTTPQQDVCQLPFVSGPCDQSIMQWFYDASSDSCNQFTYGGCEGNGNRFSSLGDCERQCRVQTPATTPTPSTTIAAEVITIPSECQISRELEECVESGEVWFLDMEQRACVALRNEGPGPRCRHTGVFYSQEACERSCGAFRGLDVCRYSLDPGPCHESVPKVYYETATSRCEPFTYGGCHGGPNRFSTIEECEQICRPNADPCGQSPEPGNCLSYFLMWYYDSERNICDQFVYGGCNGNDNRFETQAECEGRCKKEATTTFIPTTASLTTTTTVAPSPTPEFMAEAECATPVSLAPCGENVTVYYFDTRTQACLVGDFGACRYSNSYRTEEECQRRCGAFRELDVCGSRLDPGPCLNTIPKFYWDPLSGRCLSFAYGGCHGGPNRFSTEDECEEICGATGPEARCLAPVSSGAPGCGTPSRRWYYSAGTGDCVAFVYSGCGGNDNNFHTYEECALCKRVPSPSSEQPQVPSANAATEPEVHASLGGTATLRCLFHGNPPPKISWQRGQVLIEADVGRYRLLSDGALEIVSLYRNDSGVYICIADNGLGIARQEINLQVDDPETGNEVLPDCDVYNAECAALQCEYGVQRTRSRSGCESCTCVAPEVDCAQLARDCLDLKCNYGKQKIIDDDGCERCNCIDHPCANKECSSGERCVAIPYRDPITLDILYSSDCRLAIKSGSCPSNAVSVSSNESRCRRQCNDDADCPGVGKCCERGCSQLCVEPQVATSPAPTVTSYVPELPQVPSANAATEPEVHASLGGTATLRCLFHGNPPPKITWQRGQVLIEADVGRYRLLSDGALEIVSLYRNDSGVYICIADNGLGIARQEINLQVDDGVEGPAGIAGLSDAVVVGELGQSLSVRCMAYGYPTPSIYWYHGRNGPMVPFSSPQYEARDNVLQIRKLSIDTLGEYICQTYNGIGKPVDWSITVKAYRTDDFDDSLYLVPRQNEAQITPRQPQTEATTTIAPEIEIPVYTVPVTTRIVSERTRLAAGSELNLLCEVDGYPVPEVYWTKDSVPISSDDRITVTETRLTVSRTDTNDTGVYSCHAFNAFNSHYSSVQISVEGLYIPPTCKDNPYFANCYLIVRSKFCYHKYYSNFCCKSCVEAGQLDLRDLQLQADDTLYRK